MSKGFGRILAVALLGLALALPAAQQPDRRRTESQLRELNQRLERVRRQVQQDAAEKDRLSRDLRDAERKVSKAQTDLTRLRAQRGERSAAREKLAREREQREADQRRTEEALAEQLRAAYFMGRNEPLKLLLNQRSPAEFGRNLTYYGYLGRLRADQIDQIKQNIAEIDELGARIDAEDAELARLEQEQKARVAELDGARRERGKALTSLEREARNRTASLQRMQREQQQLERLLRELSRAVEAAPYDPNSPFARVRGQLAWPVAGRIAVNYGAAVSAGLKSNGIEINAARGADVRALHEGEVVFADWLSGRGLLIIIDHGNQYLSLYGHNEQLFKKVGDRVSGREVIASVGDTGGRSEPGLYFEIRRAGKPVDPRGWFRTRSP